MQATLSTEQQSALRDRGDQPLELVDPQTQRVYLLVPREQYDRLRAWIEGEPMSREEQRRLLMDAGKRANWDDPAMDAYDRYDEHRNKQP